jgi:hypothetical protein
LSTASIVSQRARKRLKPSIRSGKRPMMSCKQAHENDTTLYGSAQKSTVAGDVVEKLLHMALSAAARMTADKHTRTPLHASTGMQSHIRAVSCWLLLLRHCPLEQHAVSACRPVRRTTATLHSSWAAAERLC